MPETRRGLEGGRGLLPIPAIHLLNGSLLLGLWWWSWRVFDQLPDHIPGHIGPGGIRWDETTFRSWFALPLLAAGLSALHYGLGPVVRRSRRVNVPSSIPFEDLLPGDQDEVLQLVVRFLHWMNALLLAGLWILQIGSYETAVGLAEGVGLTTVMGILFVVLVPSFAALVFFVLITRAVADAEARVRDLKQDSA